MNRHTDFGKKSTMASKRERMRRLRQRLPFGWVPSLRHPFRKRSNQVVDEYGRVR